MTKQLSPSIDFLPTPEDVEFYDEHGWYLAPPVLSDEILETARRGAQRLYRGERDRTLPVSEGYSDWRPEDGDGVRNNEFVSLQVDQLAQLVLAPVIGAIAAKLAGTDSIRLLDDQLVYKPPGAASTGWHADHAYWGTCSSQRLLTAWIPFRDISEDDAPLVVLDGSHRWPGLEHTRFFNDPDLEAVEDRMRKTGREVRRVPLTMRKGQLSFHHCWTLHASLPNRSDDARLALAVHMQDADNRYCPAHGPTGKPVHIFDEQLCRRLPNGDPDFADPDVFPTLWARA